MNSIFRHPANRAYVNLCRWLAEHNPDWTLARVEAEATKIRLGVEPDPRKTEGDA